MLPSRLHLLRRAAPLLQLLVLSLGACMFASLLWEPQVEGRNVDATWYEIYFTDPFLVYVYLGSIPLFIAMYHVISLLRILKSSAMHVHTVSSSLRTIFSCGLVLLALLGAAELYFIFFQSREEDIAGGVAMGVLGIISISAMTITAAIFQRKLSITPVHAIAIGE